MQNDSQDAPTATYRTETESVSRRRLLTGAATAGLATAGIGTASTTAAAQSTSVEMIRLCRGVDGWLGGDWSAEGSLPVADELFVYIHGWLGDLNARQQTSRVLRSVESGGFDPDAAVGIEWPATNLWYPAAERDTEKVGAAVADLVENFYDAGGGNIRLIGHSLGGRSVYWTITKLESGYELETVAGLGAAADGGEICSTWNIDGACEVRNYHSENDRIVSAAYGSDALGVDGANCDPGGTYADVDVTDSVSGHLDHIGNEAVGAHIASVVTDGDC